MGAHKMEGGFVGFDLGKDKTPKVKISKLEEEKISDIIEKFTNMAFDGMEKVILFTQNILYSTYISQLTISIGWENSQKVAKVGKSIYKKYTMDSSLSIIDIHNSIGHYIYDQCKSDPEFKEIVNKQYKGLEKKPINVKIIKEVQEILNKEFPKNKKYQLYTLMLVGGMIYCIASAAERIFPYE